jgi:hypothetical protein
MLNIILSVVFSVFIGTGILLTLIPLVPGILVMFVLSVIFAIITGFSLISVSELSVLGGILLISVIVDFSAGLIGAKYGGASKYGLYYGLISLIIGFLLLPPFGGFVGMFAGVLLAEILAGRDEKRAIRAALGSVAGSFVGVAINVILAVIFFILFVVFLFTGKDEQSKYEVAFSNNVYDFYQSNLV